MLDSNTHVVLGRNVPDGPAEEYLRKHDRTRVFLHRISTPNWKRSREAAVSTAGPAGAGTPEEEKHNAES